MNYFKKEWKISELFNFRVLLQGGDGGREQNWTKVYVPSVVLHVGFFHIYCFLSIINTFFPPGNCVFILLKMNVVH